MVCHVCRSFLRDISTVCHFVTRPVTLMVAQVRSLQGTQNAARRLLDSMTALSGTVSEVSSAPAATIGRWAADQVAPAYWRPNADIVNCHHCGNRFDTTDKIHHCRACGEGFCSTCSSELWGKS